MAKKFLLTVLMLWLPFYTGAAAAMVICKQNLANPASGHMTHAVEADVHAGHGDAHAGHGDAAAGHAQHGDANHSAHHAQNTTDCNQCALCHIACAPWLGQSAASSFVPAPEHYLGAYVDNFSSLSSPPSGRPPAV